MMPTWPVNGWPCPGAIRRAGSSRAPGTRRAAHRALAGADARVEQRQPSAILLDDVHVRRTARLGERHRDRDAMDSEGGEAAHCSFFTASAISGSALKRSATSP